jgi:LacI family transcriptional regulator
LKRAPNKSKLTIMAQKSVKLKDVAQSLGLSISTVNAALQNRSDISPATRQRVYKKVREMNYRPNLLARSLVTRATNVLCVVVPDLSRSFFAEVAKGIDIVASAAGYHLLLSNTGEDAAREDEELQTVMSKQVDGLILASAHPPGSRDICKRLIDSGIPFVLIDRYLPRAHFVGGDDVKIGYEATQHLLQQGYTRIAHLRGPNVSTAIGRLEGYGKALRQNGISPKREYVVEAHYHEEESGFKAMKKLLQVAPLPDAVFAASDPMAIGALQAVLEMGLSVPKDIGMVGVGNHSYTQYLKVPLTTVDQNRVEIGRRAASLLISLVKAARNGRPTLSLIEPKLIVRESSLRPLRSSGPTRKHASRGGADREAR